MCRGGGHYLSLAATFTDAHQGARAFAGRTWDNMTTTETTEQPKKPRKQRKTSGRRKTKRCTTHLTPETRKIWDQGRAAWAVYMRSCKAKYPVHLRSRTGVPDGMRRAEAEPLWAAAREKAAWIMGELERHGII